MLQTTLSRRENLLGFLPAFALYALLGEGRLVARPRSRSAQGWFDAQQSIAQALSSGAIDGWRWCVEVERLGREVDRGELLTMIAKARTRPAPAGGSNDPAKRFIEFLDKEGRPRRLAYGVALFDFAPTNVITPHGHRNMVSAHMVIEGAVRVRNFDRVGDEEGAMLIRPTRDYVARKGHVSTMCSERDNVHWFVPDGGAATTFDVIISGLSPSGPDHVIEAVDPVRGIRLAGGVIRAPIIDFADASRRYTADI